MSALTRPLLRWHGGKWRLAPWIVEHFPAHRTYVEPFGGAASVLLRKDRSQAEVYNDLDGAVVNLFRVLRSDLADSLIRALILTPFSRAEFDQAHEDGDDPVERARRVIIRSFMGFGSNAVHRKSGFRANGIRAGTLPQHDWASYPDSLALIVERLRGVVIENRAAIEIIRQQDRTDTLFYVDPPYVSDTRDGGADYAFELTDEDHRCLIAALKDVAGAVVLSGYAHPLYDDALAGWRRVARDTFADGARLRTEVLWLNPACAAALDRRGAKDAGPLFRTLTP